MSSSIASGCDEKVHSFPIGAGVNRYTVEMEGVTAGFRSLLEEKEKEILNIHESKVSELEQQILVQKKEFLALENLYVQLQEDFKYNLALLDERDEELEQYESFFQMIETSLKEKDSAMEELRHAMSKSETDYTKEKEEATNCQKALQKTIHCLKQELEELQIENDAKFKKQAQSFQLSKEEWKNEILEKEKQLHELKKFEEEHVQNLAKQLLSCQRRFDAVDMKLRYMDAKYLQLEKAMKLSLDDEMRKIEELTFDVQRIIADEDNLQIQYHNNLRRLRDDAKAKENEYFKNISKEAEKNTRLIQCLKSSESRLQDFEATMAEGLHKLSRKMKSVEQELLDLKAYESKSNQKIENHYSELIQLHEIHVNVAQQEALKWKAECDNLHIKCSGLEKISLRNKDLEIENSRLQERLIAQKDENEKIQNVVAMLRMEMEALQDATVAEKTDLPDRSSRRQIEVEAEKHIKQELDFLKQRIMSISSKLDGINSTVPITRKLINSSEIFESNVSGEKLCAKISELEQTQTKLKAQLEATLAHAAKIADERDLLMDLNNSLHADLSRITLCGCVENHHAMDCKEGKPPLQNMHTVPSHCCATWNRCSEADAVNQCRNDVLPNPSTHDMRDQKVDASKARLHVEGNNAKYHERTTSDVIHKGTSSQHARLKSLLRKHEDMHTKPKVRNYNIKDDGLFS